LFACHYPSYNASASTDTLPLSLHDALPICSDPTQGDHPGRLSVEGQDPEGVVGRQVVEEAEARLLGQIKLGPLFLVLSHGTGAVDRKSTRLNSSHVKISYAVFCLKKKKTLI